MTTFRSRAHRARMTFPGVVAVGSAIGLVVIVTGAWTAAREADTAYTPSSRSVIAERWIEAPIVEAQAAAPGTAGRTSAPMVARGVDSPGVKGGTKNSGVDERVVRTGSIHGRVVRVERPRRRVAERYPTAGRGSAREALPVPPVVHLEGRLPGARAGAADEVRMSQRDTTFVPGAAAVPVGTSVAFPNEDPFFHNVFSYSRAKRFDLGRFPQGESKSVVFDEPGYVKVFCEVHQWMRAGILVTDTPFHQVVEDDGTFRLDGVPEGRHTLVVTDFERGATEVEVRVPAGGRVEVTVEVEG